jgi:hypothetical protein
MSSFASATPFARGVDSCWRWVSYLCAEKVTAAITYTFMIALLTYAILTMRRRDDVPQTPVFIAAFSWMVILSTLQISLDLADFATGMQSMNQQLQQDPSVLCKDIPWRAATQILYYAQWSILAANILVADGILVFRCFVLWGKNTRVIVVPILLVGATVVTTSVVPTGKLDERIALGLGLATNILLLGLVVGRIMWSTRAMGRFGLAASGRHKFAMSVAIQSGVLYTATALIVLISGSIGRGANLAFFISAGAARHVVNIVPILAIVESGLADESSGRCGSASEVDEIKFKRPNRASRASDAESQRGLVVSLAATEPIDPRVLPTPLPPHVLPKIDVELERKIQRFASPRSRAGEQVHAPPPGLSSVDGADDASFDETLVSRGWRASVVSP